MEQPLYFYGHTGRSGPKKVLSNWYQCEFIDPHDAQSYLTTEQYMMAKKAQLFKDDESYISIMNSSNPNDAKLLGRKVKNFNQDIWNKNAKNIVICGCYLKFTENESLKAFLLSTGNRHLVEASPYDKIWGIGISLLAAKSGKPWNGTNWLGECLMKVRELIKNNGNIDQYREFKY